MPAVPAAGWMPRRRCTAGPAARLVKGPATKRRCLTLLALVLSWSTGPGASGRMALCRRRRWHSRPANQCCDRRGRCTTVSMAWLEVEWWMPGRRGRPRTLASPSSVGLGGDGGFRGRRGARWRSPSAGVCKRRRGRRSARLWWRWSARRGMSMSGRTAGSSAARGIPFLVARVSPPLAHRDLWDRAPRVWRPRISSAA